MMTTITNILEVEKHIDDVEAVIFDLDDTLYSEKDYVKSGFRAVADHFCMPEIAGEMWEAFLNGEKAIDSVFRKHSILQSKNDALYAYRTHYPEIELYSGVREMLERIRKSKKTGMITDGRPEGQRAKINALHIKELFCELIITDELGGIGYRKPQKTAFLLMSQKLAVFPEKMVYVGDNIEKDFMAPEQLGMKSIYFKNTDGIHNRS